MMQENRQMDVQRYKRRHQKRKAWRNVVRVLACVVVFCTTYALILPAITMEKEAFCGIEAHIHEEECYGELTAVVCDPGEGPVIHSHDALCYSGETLICQLPEVAAHTHGENCYVNVTLDAHTHSESCYSPQRGNLLCEIPEEEGHTHNEACYVPGETLLCTETERPGHTHGDGCYTSNTELTCTVPETQGHTHGEACYTSASNLTCTLAEGEDHTHGDGCYETTKTLTCTEAEVAAHTHGDGCYSTTQTLTCTETEDPGHTHGNSCYEQILSCTLEEKAGHTHEDACFEMVPTLSCGMEERAETIHDTVLMCTIPELAVHTHEDSCYTDGILTCQIQCATEHQHTEACIQTHAQIEENLICEIEVHEHTLPCFSNPEADVETKEDWEKSISKVDLTGNWRQDVLAIAKSQLGYNESTKNYIVEEDGETMKGYTRYGAWYGAPYGDWCAMYASFCIRYAGVPGMPLDANCPNWIRQLDHLGLYHGEDDYIPESGDLIFFDWNGDGSSDHVGIVVEVDGDTVKTIEGNSGDTVGYHTYNLSDSDIQGYGRLPSQEDEEENKWLCGKEEHAHTEACYDAEGNLTCGLEEHTHTEECAGRKLVYTDGTLQAFVTIKGVADLPEDLSVQVWEITSEEEPDTYEALHEALTQQANNDENFISRANYYGMELYSQEAPYELPETAEVTVDVEFIQPLFDAETVENGTGTKTYLLTPGEAEPAQEEAAQEEEGGIALMSLFSLRSAEEEEPALYQAEEVTEPVYEGEEDGLTAVSFATSRIATFAVARTTDAVVGTYFQRIYDPADIESGATYMIVSAEGGYALAGERYSNYQSVVYQAVKGNPGYYTISNSDDNNLHWIITKSGSNYIIQNVNTSNYINMGRDTRVVYSDSANLTITATGNARCMRIANGDYYLRNEGSDSFTRTNGNDGTYTRNEVGYNVNTVMHNTKDMVIFKLMPEGTSLNIPKDVVSGGEVGEDGDVQSPPKPDYGSFIKPTPGLEGNTAVTLVENGVTKTTVAGKYWSDPATSDLEKNFRKATFAESAAIDGKVMSDKSVIYGDDDYGAFDSYDPNTFGVTLSALGQAYEVPYAYTVKTPVDLVYVLDVSGSMSDEYQDSNGKTTTRARELVTAVNTSIAQIMEAHTANRVSIVLYSSGSWEMLPLDRYTATNNQFLVYDTKDVSTSNGYEVETDVIKGGSTLKNAAGKSFANVGDAGTTQGIGTYTQAGIAQGYKEFLKVTDINDIYYTATVGEGENQREITVTRQPVFVLLSDGEPTHSTNNYADVLNGPHYGDGTSSPTTANYSSGNGKGIHGYNTVLSANYYKRMVGYKYQKEALFYTIGMGINATGDTALVSTSQTGDAYKRAVLNPNATTIAQDSSNASVTINMLEEMLLGTYSGNVVTTSSQWPDTWWETPHADIPVVKPNPYAGDYSYANQSYFGELGASRLEEIFAEILNFSSSVSDYGFILYSNSSVTMHDAIGAGMEIKGDPVLRYGGSNYAYTGKTTSGNVTTYVYDADFEDPYIPDYKKDLSKITVTVTKNADGTQNVKMVVPDIVLPIYMPELTGEDYYYESLPVRLIYQVGLTADSQAKVLELEKTGGKLTFYTNKYGSQNTDEQSRTVLIPSVGNPFYQYDENNQRPYEAHHDLKVKRDENGIVVKDAEGNPVLDNRTQTLEFSTDCSDTTYNTETYQVIHTLGNNGKLEFEAEAPTNQIPVEKKWVNVADKSNLKANVTLYKVDITTGESGAEIKTVTEVATAELNETNNFQTVFEKLKAPEGNSYYAIAETPVEGFTATYTGGDLVELTVNGQVIQAVKVTFDANSETPTVAVPVVVTNAPPAVLPETGGPGTILYTTGGLLLMLAAVILLNKQYQMQKRRKEGSSPF